MDVVNPLSDYRIVEGLGIVRNGAHFHSTLTITIALKTGLAFAERDNVGTCLLFLYSLAPATYQYYAPHNDLS